MTGPTTPLTPAGIEAELRRLFPLYEHIGLRVESLGDTIVCAVPLTEANSNHLGGVHAAVQWAVAEATGGVVYFAHPEFGPCWIAVRNVTIEFLKVARTDLRAEATCGAAAVASIAEQLDGRGIAEYAIDISLRDTADQVVTTAVGHYYLRRTTGDRETVSRPARPSTRRATGSSAKSR
ncbi:MAG: DUF4442 domain-containing protein [Actinobacteria bacterium]|nr:DUF4442 domain-containing protein [Actinomycetota bacterium]